MRSYGVRDLGRESARRLARVWEDKGELNTIIDRSSDLLFCHMIRVHLAASAKRNVTICLERAYAWSPATGD